MSPAQAERRVQPRDDLRALDGYHSPQVDVAVRLNTNESPVPAAARVRRARISQRWATSPGTGIPTAARDDLREALGAFLGQPPHASCAPTGATRCCRRSCSPTAAPAGAR